MTQSLSGRTSSNDFVTYSEWGANPLGEQGPAGSVRDMAPRNLAILVHDDVEVLDFCGPFEAFGVTGDSGEAYFNVFTVADERASSGPTPAWLIQPNHQFARLPAAVDALIQAAAA